MSELYTEQKELDGLHFGAMWGCYATGFLNIVEHEIRRKLHEAELNQIIGAWFRLGLVALCNYKHHDFVTTPGAAPDGWGAKANPEWHYWVMSRRATLLVAMEVVGLTDLTYTYYTVIMDVTAMGGVRHFTTEVEGQLINPDPGLIGPEIERRRIQV